MCKRKIANRASTHVHMPMYYIDFADLACTFCVTFCVRAAMYISQLVNFLTCVQFMHTF